MKTKNAKGFTLIELIVVIAIIGVLAAILVPTMLGYVTKSKITSANSAAESFQSGLNTVLISLDGEGIDVADQSAVLTISATTTTFPLNQASSGTVDISSKISQYFEDWNQLDAIGYSIEGMVCEGAAIKDGSYFGSAPVPTSDDKKAKIVVGSINGYGKQASSATLAVGAAGGSTTEGAVPTVAGGCRDGAAFAAASGT